MKLYTKIINKDTKECLIINQIEAKKQGLQDMEVEFGYNGKAYLKGYAPQKPLEDLKKEKIQELKNNCQKYIYSKYPIYKQLNATNGLVAEEEVSQMITFIQKARLICEDIEQQINSVKTQNELENISTNFNQE